MSAYNYTTAIYILLEYACTGLALLLMVIVLVKLALAGQRRRADSASPPQPDRRRGGSINYTLSVSDSQPQDSGIIGRSKLDMMTPHPRNWKETPERERHRCAPYCLNQTVIDPHGPPSETWGNEWGVDRDGNPNPPQEPLVRL